MGLYRPIGHIYMFVGVLAYADDTVSLCQLLAQRLRCCDNNYVTFADNFSVQHVPLTLSGSVSVIEVVGGWPHLGRVVRSYSDDTADTSLLGVKVCLLLRLIMFMYCLIS